MEKLIPDEKIHEGHRGRMRSKLLNHGQQIFDTYELLEMLLYQVVPYRDTNPIAKRLLFAFGGLDGVFLGDRDELMKIDGIGECGAEFINKVGRLSDVIGAEIISGSAPDLSSYERVGEYLTDYFRDVEDKCVVALFLDSSMRLLKLKKLYDLEYESGGVRAKAFLDEAVASNAAVIISAHNHPYSSCYPTPGDRETNALITDALTTVGFVHAEHYIISGDMYAGIGSLNRFTPRLRQMPAVSQFIASREAVEGDEIVISRTKRAAKALILPDEIYNKNDADYFFDLLSYVVGKKAMEHGIMLLKRYQSIENIFTASVGELCDLVGERCTFYMKLLAYITARRITESFTTGRSYSSAEIADYFKAVFLGDAVEKIYLMCFDDKDRMSGCHLLAEGTVSSSEVLPRKAVEKALASSARSVVIAHNHPFGSIRPSIDDVNMTKLFYGIFHNCDITLKEHYIVAGQLCGTVCFDK